MIKFFFHQGLSDVQMIFLPAGIRYLEADAFNGLSMIGHLKLAHLDVQGLDSFVFRGLNHVQVSPSSTSHKLNLSSSVIFPEIIILSHVRAGNSS